MTLRTGSAKTSRIADSSGRDRSSSRPIRVGLLGAGYIADWHAHALKSVAGVSVVAACDMDRDRAQALARRHRIGQVYTSLAEMVAAREIDAVHVLLPPEQHYEAALQLIESGLHVLLEKPMALEVGHCDSLMAAATRHGVRIGVSHNFLFGDPYDRLRADLAAGRLGRLDHVTITWAKPLDVLRSGPYDLWMLRDPRHILLEIGSHSVAHLLDIAGPRVDVSRVLVSRSVNLPGCRRFYRRWQIDAECGSACAVLNLSFSVGFVEHTIHVRGSLASATVDFERDSYVLRQHSPYGVDLDRFWMAFEEASQLGSQARRGLFRYVASTLKLSTRGKPYGEGIARALRAHYAGIGGPAEARVSPEMGRDVVATCLRIAGRTEIDSVSSRVIAAPQATPAGLPEVLVLGAAGFIGGELVRQLANAGHFVRLLVRNPERLPDDLRRSCIEIIRGDAGDDATIDRAAKGMKCVYHLARAQAKTWEEFYRDDVQVTRRVAEACLRQGVGRLIYTGTIDSYYAGANASTITEKTPLDPQIRRRNNYARAKAFSEELLLQMRRDQGLPVSIFRPGIVVGKGGSPLHWGVGMWSHDSVCQVWGRGDHPLPLVLVEDVARALVLALDANNIAGESFNLVAAPSVSAREYLHELARAAGGQFRVLHRAPWRLYAADLFKWAIKQIVRHPERSLPSYRDWETRTQRATYDCTKARLALDWAPTDDREELIRRGIHLPAEEFFA
jgi:nucleoside-diphosphate-sugar epimerase/predicted dehydrogenase